MGALMRWLTAACLGLALQAALVQDVLADGGIRRFALVIGANDGGPDRATLRYAEADARTVAHVLTELGGVSPRDRVLVVDPDKLSLVSALGELRGRIEAVGLQQRTEVVVYYSGHSDERGLLLGTQRFTYKELRDALANLDSDVRIAILDSCSSGAMVTGKGGRHVAGFLDNQANQVAGHAYLTSSAADEVSQEAASLGGSYFTHALVTGLRGAADANADRLVTLNEAYRFAFDETLARTESSRFGAQHANFDIQLSGSGDLVMTDLRDRTATLELDDGMSGRVFVRDEDGRLMAELGKAPGRPVALLLEPGKYSVTLEREEGTYSGTARIDGATPAALAFGDLSAVSVEATVARGGGSPDRPLNQTLDRVVDAMMAETELVSVGLVVEGEDLTGSALGLGVTSYSGRVSGIQGALGANRVQGDLAGAQLSMGANVAQADSTGLQATLAFNVAEEMAGLAQVSSVANIALGGGEGTQVSTGLNVAGGDVQGAQVAALLNVANGRMAGAQVAAGGNIASGDFSGAQVSAGINVADGLAGFQGAVINVAGDGRGAQTGVINIAGDFDGGMVGVVNIAKHADAPVGILNIVGDGIHALETSWGNDGIQGTLKLGGRRVYTSYAVRYSPDRPEQLGDWQVGLAFGGRDSYGWADTDVDLGADYMTSSFFGAIEGERDPNIIVPRLRLTAGLPLFDGHVVPFVGGTLNLGVALSESRPLPASLPRWTVSDQVGAWPAFEGGVRVEL